VTRSEFIDWLREIERRYPVDRWQVHGVRVWPLVRLNVYATSYEAMAVGESLAAGKAAALKALARAYAAWARARLSDRGAHRAPTAPGDAVFLAYSAGRQPLVGGRHVNPLLFPYVQLLASRGLTSTVWEMAPFSHYNQPRATPSHLVQARLVSARLASVVMPARLVTGPGRLESFEAFCDEVRAAGLSLRYGHRLALYRDAWFIVTLARQFERWLRRVRPLVGWVADYGPREQAFCLACARLGLPVVEIQHGVQGALHPAYASWERVPAGGYETRPTVYWCWDEDSAGTIAAWAGRVERGPSALAAGDPWREQWFGTPQAEMERLDAEVRARLAPGGRRHVLVTLDSVGEAVPGVVLEALRRHRDRWRPWFRMHPSNQRGRVEQTCRRAAEAGVSAEDVRWATEVPLHALLRHVDLHVNVGWSTVIAEAADFGVPSVACAAQAREFYGDLEVRGLLRIAEGGEALAAALASGAADTRHVTSRPPRDVAAAMDRMLAIVSAGRAPAPVG
jgi:hypothetical protein